MSTGSEPPRPPRGLLTPNPNEPARADSPTPDEKTFESSKSWIFIPEEMNELYAGKKWPNLYNCLLLEKYCDTREILPAFEKQIIQHFPDLRKPYKPNRPGKKFERFLRFTLNKLPFAERRKYEIPYRNFAEVLDAYRKEWADWTKRPRSRSGPRKMFEEIFLAFIILNNPYYREQYDENREFKDPLGSGNKFYSTLSLVPNYVIRRERNGSSIKSEQSIANIGTWVTTDVKKCMDCGRGKLLDELAFAGEIGLATEKLEWEYKMGNGFHLVQRQQRSCRTGWWVEIEKLADLALFASTSPLFGMQKYY